MIFATFFPYLRQKHAFSFAEHMGSFGAHTDLLLSCLRHGIISEAHIITGADSSVAPRADTLPGPTERAFLDLQTEFGTQVKRKAIHELPEILSRNDCIFVDKAPSLLGLMQVRRGVGAPCAPTCSIIHSVNWANLFPTYLATLSMQENYDAMVVSSSSAGEAVNTIIKQASESLRNRFGIQGHLPHSRVEKIPMGVDPEAFRILDRGLARSLLNLPEDGCYLLYFGRLSEEYKADLEPLLRVVAVLCHESPSLRLIIAGHDGHEGYSEVLARVAGTLGISDRLTILTDLSPITKRVVYSAADIFVSPADNIQESFGIALLEAMAAGLPVIASDWSGYRDIVEDNVTGYRVKTLWTPSAGHTASWFAPMVAIPTAEYLLAQQTVVDSEGLLSAVRHLVNNPSLCVCMGEAGKQRVIQNFTWKTIAQKYGNLWQSQIKSAKRAIQNPVGPLNYDSVFAHYASSTLAPSTLMRRTDHGTSFLQLPPDELPSWCSQVFLDVIQFASETVTFADMTALHPDEDMGHIVAWLLKKGALQVQE